MYEIFLSAFITLFVVIDPLGIAPIFAVMTHGTSAQHKRAMIFKALMISSVILLLFAFFGHGLLGALGISMPAFRTAGGFLLFLIAMEMVFEKRTERREKKAEGLIYEEEGQVQVVHEEEPEDISVFPLAIPFISGPGSIATLMLMLNQHKEDYAEQGMILAALGAALLSTVIILLASTRIMDFLGQTVANAITRILGVILAAMATQFMIDGIKASFLNIPT